MKKVFLNSIAIIALLSCGGFAQAISPAAQADLTERLRVEAEGFKHDIATLHGESLVEAANIIVGSGVSDPDLYKVVDAKVNEVYQEHLRSPKDKNIALELVSLIRAYASIDPQSRSLLEQILNVSKYRAVRERAVRLLPKLYWFAQRNSLMQKPDFYEPGQDLMTYRFMNLITSNDPVMRRYAAEEINRRKGAEPAVYQKMAEKLEKDKHSIGEGVDLDAYAWFCRILRDYDRQKWSQLLSALTNDPSVNKKIKRFTK